MDTTFMVVNDYQLGNTLGEGTYGKVKAAEHLTSKTPAAVKILHKEQDKENSIRKEICVHKMLKHPNITQYLSSLETSTIWYIFLELQPGGELYDRIEVDRGMSEDAAHFYFTQLLNAMEYLHRKGVVHRDIKPENILLDKFGNVKLADFGLATLFCHKGIGRRLNKRCGTPPYTAPEVFSGPDYHGPTADTWSCAVVLVAMATGCLPWDEPVHRCKAYKDWSSKNYEVSPWRALKQREDLFDLITRMLKHDEKERDCIAEIYRHPWMSRETAITLLLNDEGLITEEVPLLRARQHSNLEMGSAPQIIGRKRQKTEKRQKTDKAEKLTQLVEELSQVTQLFATQGQRPMADRETRFTSILTIPETIASIMMALSEIGIPSENIVYKGEKATVIVTTTDSRGDKLQFVGRIFTQDANDQEKHLVDFRLSRGDGIEFKRKFWEMCEYLLESNNSINTCTLSTPASRP
eukprot:m.51358 g.51358  ORF g.51358 m.51358 type:complete len:465 (+) comp10729_c0_seq2:227-1621(+)